MKIFGALMHDDGIEIQYQEDRDVSEVAQVQRTIFVSLEAAADAIEEALESLLDVVDIGLRAMVAPPASRRRSRLERSEEDDISS